MKRRELADSVTEFIYFSFSANASNRVNFNAFLIIDAMSCTRTQNNFSTQFSIFAYCEHRMCKNMCLQFTQTYFHVLREKSFQYYLHFYSTRRIRQTISLNIWGFRFTLGKKSKSFIWIIPLLIVYCREVCILPICRETEKKTHTHEIELNADLIIISISSTSLFISFSLVKAHFIRK